MGKPLTVWIIKKKKKKLWIAFKVMEVEGHLTFLLRNLCAGQEATFRILCGTTEWFKTEKGI